jgi:hypothetical protein
VPGSRPASSPTHGWHHGRSASVCLPYSLSMEFRGKYKQTADQPCTSGPSTLPGRAAWRVRRVLISVLRRRCPNGAAGVGLVRHGQTP